MSLRNRFVLPFILSTLAILSACGGSSSPPVVAPPTGGFSTSNLNGTYVFSVSGTDTVGAPYAIVGTFTANGTGGITGGTVDVTDLSIGQIANSPVSNNGTYQIGVDGRGRAALGTSTPFGTIIFAFALQDSAHGLITEFDGNASGSGTMDLQTSGVSPVGSYAFSFSGADGSSGNPFVTVGNFALGSGGAISAGLQDFNDGGFVVANQGLSGTVVAGPSSTPATTLTTTQLGAFTYDVYAVDANHLKFIEMDGLGTLAGDAFSQTSTTVPTGALAFALEGFTPSGPTAAGGFMVTDGAGAITNASTEDVNANLSISPTPLVFSGSYTVAGTGRYTLNLATGGFFGGTTYAAYPYSGGLFLLEIGNDSIIMAGAAYPQSDATFAADQGYALNLTGINTLALGTGEEVDDIAEFTAANSGTTVTGLIDENFAPGGIPTFKIPLNGTYTAPDTSGRGFVSAAGGNSSISTLNGGFLLTFYSVDGTTFPFIESDNGQVAAGVFVQQNASASASAAAAKAHMFVVRPLVKAHAAQPKKNQPKNK